MNLNDYANIVKTFNAEKVDLNSTNYYNFNYRPKLLKRGGEIKIKKLNKGSFTRYCGGNVTEECIRRGKRSPDPKIRKKATFAANARKWKH